MLKGKELVTFCYGCIDFKNFCSSILNVHPCTVFTLSEYSLFVNLPLDLICPYKEHRYWGNPPSTSTSSCQSDVANTGTHTIFSSRSHDFPRSLDLFTPFRGPSNNIAKDKSNVSCVGNTLATKQELSNIYNIYNIFIFKVPSSHMRQAGLMNLSILEEREEESREAVPVLWFNQHGPRVKGKFHVPNLAFRRDGMISQVEQSGELGGGWEEEGKSQSLVGGDRTLRCLQTETCESTYQCASIRLL